MNDEILFTPAAVLDLLSQIAELDGQDISLAESDGTVLITIGESAYEIPTSNAVDVPVEEEVIEQVAEANDEGYSNIDSDVVVEESEAIEGGPIKELLKTLFLGGMVRLQNKMMSKDQFDAFAEQAQKWRR